MAASRSTSGGYIAVRCISLSEESTITQLMSQIMNANSRLNCTFSKLTPKDLKLFHVEGKFDAVVLLHSITQGRNSITDVADAKYSKLLPQLMQTYGSHRVGVIVHSMQSYNPSTSNALMMVFKKSQPTTFKCSNCVIQCGNPAEMPEAELARLVGFLEQATSHPLPPTTTDDKVSPSPRTAKESEQVSVQPAVTSSSTEKDVPPPVGGTEPKRHCVTTGSDNANDVPCDESESTGKQAEPGHTPLRTDTHASDSTADHGPDEMSPAPKSASSQSQCNDNVSSGVPLPVNASAGTFVNAASRHLPSDSTTSPSNPTNQSSGASIFVDKNTNPSGSVQRGAVSERSATYDRPTPPVLDHTYPVALLVIPPFPKPEDMRTLVQPSMPGKTIMTANNHNFFKNNWHLFEAVLLDVGHMKTVMQMQTLVHEHVSNIHDKIRDPRNLAVLVNVLETSTWSMSETASGVPVFIYRRSDASTSTIFDDNTTNKLQSWLRACNGRYVGALGQPRGQPLGQLQRLGVFVSKKTGIKF